MITAHIAREIVRSQNLGRNFFRKIAELDAIIEHAAAAKTYEVFVQYTFSNERAMPSAVGRIVKALQKKGYHVERRGRVFDYYVLRIRWDIR